MIRSTDSDLLFVFLAVHHHFTGMEVFINYNTANAYFTKYADGKKLIKELKDDPAADLSMVRSQLSQPQLSLPHMFSLLHFITGSDEISHMRGFTKGHCIKSVLRYGNFIFNSATSIADLLMPENIQLLVGMHVRMIVALYSTKHADCFDTPLESLYGNENDKQSLATMLDSHREQTWHKTISDNTTVPYYSSVFLRCKRILHSLQKVFNATSSHIPATDPNDWGWKVIDGNVQIEVIIT